ncbi:MAG: DUF1080 domain-containing protein [Planctomycetota bacterium]|nr:DUF1080 domain-containing protein [Planctomycetota bacterium]
MPRLNPSIKWLLLLICIAPISAQGQSERGSQKWRDLFDGKTMQDWKKTNYGGEGDVQVTKGQILMEFGYSMSGITYTGKALPKTSYEIRVDAIKLDGNDFFCGMTFPVAESYCSFIVGGWGGAVVGLSGLEGLDASENETTRYMTFDHNKWYRVRVRVEPHQIRCWINRKLVVYQDIEGREITTRNEVNLNQPLGFATWETRAGLKNIQIRELKVKQPK